jgi:hypothetical protein
VTRLLDATPENAPAMVRSWNQLVASVAHLLAALSSPPDYRSGSDPMERLRVVGEAICRSVRAWHWPGHGPTDDHVIEIADNLSRARHEPRRHTVDGTTSTRLRRHVSGKTPSKCVATASVTGRRFAMVRGDRLGAGRRCGCIRASGWSVPVCRWPCGEREREREREMILSL